MMLPFILGREENRSLVVNREIIEWTIDNFELPRFARSFFN
jgi:hypothetical protein